MTLPEIDHVSFLVEHAQTFFTGENQRVDSFAAHAHTCNSSLRNKRPEQTFLFGISSVLAVREME